MTDQSHDFDEQLSAFMDGELAPDQARFLLKRMAHDNALRERWERWQLASACIKGQPIRFGDAALADRIAAALHDEPRTKAGGSNWRMVGLAASVAIAILFAPRMLSPTSTQPVAATVPAGPTTVPQGLPPIDALMATSRSAAPVSPASGIGDLPLDLSASPKPWPKSPLLGATGIGSVPLQVRHASGMSESAERGEASRSQ